MYILQLVGLKKQTCAHADQSVQQETRLLREKYKCLWR